MSFLFSKRVAWCTTPFRVVLLILSFFPGFRIRLTLGCGVRRFQRLLFGQTGSLHNIVCNQLLRRATPEASRGERLIKKMREAPPFEEAHAARAGRVFFAAGAALNP